MTSSISIPAWFDWRLKTNNSLHFDLRLGTDRFNGWWGISLFAGTTEENRKELRIFRMMEDPDERLESAPKQFGPRPWLEVGKKEPLVVPPGGVGSTSKAWSKFFALDWGTISIPAWFDWRIDDDYLDRQFAANFNPSLVRLAPRDPQITPALGRHFNPSLVRLAHIPLGILAMPNYVFQSQLGSIGAQPVVSA